MKRLLTLVLCTSSMIREATNIKKEMKVIRDTNSTLVSFEVFTDR